jgi:hypothetical protein
MGQLQKENWMQERKKEAEEAKRTTLTLPVGTDVQLLESRYIVLCTAEGRIFSSEQAARRGIARLVERTGLTESDFDVMAMSYRIDTL